MATGETSPISELEDAGRLALTVLRGLPGMSVVVFDRELRIVLAGGEALARHRWSDTMLEGRLITEMLPADAYALLRANYEACLAGESRDFEYETLDGLSWYRVAMSPLRAGDGAVLGGMVVSRDVTEQHLADEALRRSRRHLQNILDGLTIPVSVKDLDRRFLMLNAEYARQAQLTSEEVVGKTVFEIYPRDFAEIYDAHDRRVLETGEPVREETRVPHGDGSIHVYSMIRAPLRDSEGTIYGLVGLGTDITDGKRAERELIEAHAAFEQAFIHAPIGTMLVDMEGRITRVNDAICEMSGMSRERLVKLTWRDFTPREEAQRELPLIEQLISGEIDRYDAETTLTRPEGGVVSLLRSVSLLRDADGEPVQFIAQIQDISRRKEIEEELRRRADHDAVTGLSSRARCQADLEQQLARCRRHGEHAALLVIDLNGFKSLNDTYGHTVGDDALRHVAALLRERARASDVIGRWGGDEFVLLAPHLRPEQAGVLVHDIAAKLAATPLRVGDDSIRLSLSIGIAQLDAGTASVTEAIAAADREMYRAKRGDAVS